MATNQPPPSTADRAGNLVSDLLNEGYVGATAQVMQALLRSSTDGLMGQRLAEFEAEAERLAAAGLPFTIDNPVFRALLADFQTTLNRQAGMVDGAATDVQEDGAASGLTLARQLSLPGFDDSELAVIGIGWNMPDPAALAQAVDYVNRPGWATEMGVFGDDILDIVNMAAIRGIAEGRNPLAVAREIRDSIETLPLWKANNLLRTLQQTSYRDATSLAYVANADILEGQIRIATLDGRTCMACVALHGTRMGIGERVNDHHAGRCTSVGIVKGRAVQVLTGIAWFEAQGEAAQREQMGHAAFEAWRAGSIRLQDFPQRYDDRVFGEMVREASLKGILGDAARQYYKNN